ncbi:GNAT family N-acetyltransferase [Lysobacter sp. PAGU 2638]
MGEAVVVAPLTSSDRADWQRLAEGYKAFYATPTTPADYNAAWARLMASDTVRGFGARLDGRLVGIVHFIFHASTWADRVCYLQDLFTDESARGRGVARALIDAVADATRANGASRLYWMTQAHNATARALYDRVAMNRGFIRYEHPLG